MVSGPVVGYFIGNWLDGKFGTDPILVIVFSVLGLAAGIKETIKVIKRIAHEEQDTDNEL